MKHLLLIPGIVLAAFLWALCDGNAGIPTWLRLGREVRAADARIEALRGEVAALREQAEQLESDPFAIERAIREGLELAQPGETVIRISPDTSSPRFP